MTACEICEAVKSSEFKLYEDEKVVAFLAPKPAVFGHIQLTTKAHYPILENVPDFEMAHISKIANKLSVTVFEKLGMQGTNMLITNGIPAGQKHPHVILNILPRREGDGLSFEWKPKQLSEEEMSTVELKLKEATKNVGAFEKEKEKPIDIEKKIEAIGGKGKENYMIKQLRKIP